MKTNYPRFFVAALCIIGMFAVLAPPAPSGAADGFFSGIPDLPVMPGLSEDRSAAVIFDKPEGRIVKLIAKGRVSKSDVIRYYTRALPQLGWNIVQPERFRRDGEILNLTISGTGKDLTIRMSLSPE